MTYVTSPKALARRFCKETKYADAYFDMLKMSPFSGKMKWFYLFHTSKI